MHFHATAAAVSVRSKRISTLRNRLLCSVCTAMLLTGSGGMALTHPSAEPSATAQPVTGTAAPIEKVSDPKPVGSRPKIDDLAVKQGDDRYFVEDEIGTATVAGRLTVSGESTVGAVTVNTGGKLYVSGHSAAGTVTVNEGGYAKTTGRIGTATIAGTDSRLDVKVGGVADTVNVNDGGYASTSGKIGTATIAGTDSRLDVLAGGEITGKSTINNGGKVDIYSDGKAGDIALNGGNSTTNITRVFVGGIAGDITLSGNAELFGDGRVGNVMVHAGGQIFPGWLADDFATLTATGNVTFDKDSFFSVLIANDGVRSSKVTAQGQAILNGGVVRLRSENIDEETGRAAILSKEQLEKLFQKSFVVLEAKNGVTGKFDNVEQQANYNYITPSLAYTDKTVSVSFDLTETAKTEKFAAESKQKQAEIDRLKEEQRVADANAEKKRIDDAKTAEDKRIADIKAVELKSQQIAVELAKTQCRGGVQIILTVAQTRAPNSELLICCWLTLSLSLSLSLFILSSLYFS